MMKVRGARDDHAGACPRLFAHHERQFPRAATSLHAPAWQLITLGVPSIATGAAGDPRARGAFAGPSDAPMREERFEGAIVGQRR